MFRVKVCCAHSSSGSGSVIVHTDLTAVDCGVGIPTHVAILGTAIYGAIDMKVIVVTSVGTNGHVSVVDVTKEVFWAIHVTWSQGSRHIRYGNASAAAEHRAVRYVVLEHLVRIAGVKHT